MDMNKHNLMEFVFRPLITVAAIIGFSTCGGAGDTNLGKIDYQSSCAACHGQNGKGNGPVSPELRTKPSDLTLIAKNNGGVFPSEVLYRIIDGRRTIRAHGNFEMPVWGLVFRSQPEDVARKRIFAIIDYLQSIQLK
jgi:mono/diheme cytochrome c family protein